MQVFGSGGMLYAYDKPGLHLHHRLPHLLSPEEYKLEALRPCTHDGGWRSTWRPRPLSWLLRQPARGQGRQRAAARAAAAVAARGTGSSRWRPTGGEAWCAWVCWPVPQPHSWCSTAPRHSRWPPARAFGTASVAARGGLRPAKLLTLPAGGSAARPQADIAVSGLPGWLAVYAGGRQGGEAVSQRVWAPVGVEVFQRPPLPVGSLFGGGAALREADHFDWLLIVGGRVVKCARCQYRKAVNHTAIPLATTGTVAFTSVGLCIAVKNITSSLEIKHTIWWHGVC